MRIFPSELPSLPIRTNESGHVIKYSRPESVQLAKNELSEYTVPCSDLSGICETLPSYPDINVSQEIATKVVRAFEKIVMTPVLELRESWGRRITIADDFGFDSLLAIELIYTIKELGVEVPGSDGGSNLEPSIVQRFLGTCILKYFEGVDGVEP